MEIKAVTQQKKKGILSAAQPVNSSSSSLALSEDVDYLHQLLK